ncbi:MAG: hypothetical protein WA908_09595 [Pontixanthobacter sp.]
MTALPYAAIVLVLLSVVLLRSVKKDGLSPSSRKTRKWTALLLGIAAVCLAIAAALDDVVGSPVNEVPTLTGDRLS